MHITKIPENSFLFPYQAFPLITEDVLNLLRNNGIVGFESYLVDTNHGGKIYEIAPIQRIFTSKGIEPENIQKCSRCGFITDIGVEIDASYITLFKKLSYQMNCRQNIGANFLSNEMQTSFFVSEDVKTLLEQNFVQNIAFKPVKCDSSLPVRKNEAAWKWII